MDSVLERIFGSVYSCITIDWPVKKKLCRGRCGRPRDCQVNTRKLIVPDANSCPGKKGLVSEEEGR